MENTDIDAALSYYKQELDKAQRHNDLKLINVFEKAIRKLENKKIEIELNESRKVLEESDTNLLTHVLKTCQHCNRDIKEARSEEDLQVSIEKKNKFKKLFEIFKLHKKFYNDSSDL